MEFDEVNVPSLDWCFSRILLNNVYNTSSFRSYPLLPHMQFEFETPALGSSRMDTLSEHRGLSTLDGSRMKTNQLSRFCEKFIAS